MPHNRFDLSYWIEGDPVEVTSHTFQSGGPYVSVNFYQYPAGDKLSIVGEPHKVFDLLTKAAQTVAGTSLLEDGAGITAIPLRYTPEECDHPDSARGGNFLDGYKCSDCGIALDRDGNPLDDDDEPTEAQLESLNNPDSGPVPTEHSFTYRDSMRDAGRGGLLR